MQCKNANNYLFGLGAIIGLQLHSGAIERLIHIKSISCAKAVVDRKKFSKMLRKL